MDLQRELLFLLSFQNFLLIQSIRDTKFFSCGTESIYISIQDDRSVQHDAYQQ